MEQLIQWIIQRLGQVPGLKYVAYNWGQLDYYDTPMPPVQWPCALIEVQQANYTNLGLLQQQGVITLGVVVAAMPIGNTSAQAPAAQVQQALAWWQLLEAVHKALHGQQPVNGSQQPVSGPLSRTMGRRLRRDDGIQCWELSYQCGLHELVAPEAVKQAASLKLIKPDVL
ncbi:MAG TPA: hypothetical protein PKD90_03480 [Phnomibacter sp.]|nr:hypothetical protein [Phnomibacter sp.]